MKTVLKRKGLPTKKIVYKALGEDEKEVRIPIDVNTLKPDDPVYHGYGYAAEISSTIASYKGKILTADNRSILVKRNDGKGHDGIGKQLDNGKSCPTMPTREYWWVVPENMFLRKEKKRILRTLNQKFEVEEGETYHAAKTGCMKTADNKSYRIGFHGYATKKSAMKWARLYDDKIIIGMFEFTDIVCRGMQYENSCYVAKTMKFIGVVEGV